MGKAVENQMRSLMMLPLLGVLGVSGCVVAPAPREHVVEREVVDPYGRVVERDRYVVDDPPPAPLVEVVPVAPYPTAVWVGGYWGHDGRHWAWRRGHWR